MFILATPAKTSDGKPIKPTYVDHDACFEAWHSLKSNVGKVTRPDSRKVGFEELQRDLHIDLHALGEDFQGAVHPCVAWNRNPKRRNHFIRSKMACLVFCDPHIAVLLPIFF